MKFKKAQEYDENIVSACKSVMVEVISCLGKYRRDFVLVGGMVPRILIDQTEMSPGHIGTCDVDFAVNFQRISKNQYATIAEMLFSHGYEYRKDREDRDLKFSFEKKIKYGNKENIVYVDLVGPEYGGKSKKGFREKIQRGVHVHKARGIDLVFDNSVEVEVKAVLPDGIEHKEKVLVVNGAAFLIVKAITFEARKENKDAYDIYYFLKNYPRGYEQFYKELSAIKNKELVKEGLAFLREFFSDPMAIGARRAAVFLSDDPNRIDALARDFSGMVNEFLDKYIEDFAVEEVKKYRKAKHNK